MNFPLATPTEGTYREPGYQARIEMYATNYFTPAEYQKVKARGISFVRGDADMIRHAFIAEPRLRHKVQVFTGSAYVYDLAHALLLQVKRTVQQLVNVPEGLNTKTLLAVLYNLKGFMLLETGKSVTRGGTEPTGLARDGNPAPPEVQLTALSTTDLRQLASGGVAVGGKWYAPKRVPDTDKPTETYPWGLTDGKKVAVECVVAQMIELCRARKIVPALFSNIQRGTVFTPLDLDAPANQRMNLALGGMANEAVSYGYTDTRYDLKKYENRAIEYPELDFGSQAAFRSGLDEGFENVIRSIQLPAGQSFGPTSVAGLDEVFRMERERDSIIAILTQWGTTGLGIILTDHVGYGQYRDAADTRGIMGNKPAYSRFSEINGMGDSCGDGYERVWFTGDPSDDKSRSVPPTVTLNGQEYRNPQATHAVCAPMTRQLRSMPYSRDVVTNPRLPSAAQRRAKKGRKRPRKTKGRAKRRR